MLRSDGLLYLKTDAALNFGVSDGPQAIVAFSKPGVALGPNNANYPGKIAAPQNFAPLFSVVTSGATDATNDLTSYASDRIYRWINDATWGLNTVGNAGQWLGPPSSLNANSTLAFAGVMLSPGDKIWARSSVAGTGVRVDGFLQKVA